MHSFVVDCDGCRVRGQTCTDCLVSAILGRADEPVDGERRTALVNLARAGLVPPIRSLMAVGQTGSSRRSA